MKITTIGRGTIGGSLARLWRAAGHEVTELGRDGGDASDADVVLLAVPGTAVDDALENVAGLEGKTIIDATNRMGGTPAPAGHASIAEFVKARTGGPVAKAFNLNFGNLFDQAADAPHRPGNIWTGDEEARPAVEQLTRDMGMQPLHAGPLTQAAAQEAFAPLMITITQDVGEGLLLYRFATPDNL